LLSIIKQTCLIKLNCGSDRKRLKKEEEDLNFL